MEFSLTQLEELLSKTLNLLIIEMQVSKLTSLIKPDGLNKLFLKIFALLVQASQLDPKELPL
jgi:hypothetical protein